jgi:hypothetical protein
MLDVFMLSIAALNIAQTNVVMLNVIIPNVVALTSLTYSGVLGSATRNNTVLCMQ